MAGSVSNLARRGTLIFGVGSLHHLPTSAQRQSLLRQAIDLGFHAFDVGPAYGNGLNELELGRALAGCAGSIRVATKFGIPVDLYGERHPHLGYAIRVWRRLTSKSYGTEYRTRVFTPGEMVRSLEGSLRRLRRDYVDDFMIHEPLCILDGAELAALHEMADRLKAAGKIRAWGVAGPLTSVFPLDHDPHFDVVQVPLADLDALADTPRRRIGYNCFRTYQTLPSTSRTDFVVFLRERMRAHGADLIVTTRKKATLASWQELFA
jgi:aryl-alcohol dehydrogenase-like predicted oxidoreductase